jgi:Holliday junction resolvase RusA-like endonuclease
MPVTIRLAGVPVAKGRPLVTRRGTFTPLKTRKAEAALRAAAKVAMADLAPFKGPVGMEFRAHFTKAKSSKFKHKTMKPDLDNLIKLCDSLNGICFHDDSQIVTIIAAKCYWHCDETVITITPLDEG